MAVALRPSAKAPWLSVLVFILAITLFFVLVTYHTPAVKPICFRIEGKVYRNHKHQVIKAWVKAVPNDQREGMYDAVSWSVESFPECRQVSNFMHFRTVYDHSIVRRKDGEVLYLAWEMPPQEVVEEQQKHL